MAKWRDLVDLVPELRAYSRSVCRDDDHAEDVLSDALERTMLSRNAPIKQGELRRWTFRVIRNLHIDHYRRARIRRQNARLIQTQQRRDTGSANPEARVILLDALERLKAQDRQIIELVDVLGLTYAEAGARLDVPAGTVMSRLSRARARLVSILSTDPDES